MKLPNDVFSYLTERGISPEVLDRNKISWKDDIGWDGERIVIPVYDKDGIFMFNKYRRSPYITTGPKYTYDKGAHSDLYHYDKIPEKGKNLPLIICEGELDALVLETHGFRSVTSTGGAGTFLDEWNPFFAEERVVLCFDNDDAGIRGMVHALIVIGHGEVVSIPVEEGVKDVTDFFLKHTTEQFEDLIAGAVGFTLPKFTTQPADKKERNRILGDMESFAEEMLNRKRAADNEGIDSRIFSMLIEAAQKRADSLEAMFQSAGRPLKDTDAVSRAKAYPITDLIRLTLAGFAPCIFHNEKTASMKYYKERNGLYCFGCSKSADAIDVVMQLEGLSFKEAVSRLN